MAAAFVDKTEPASGVATSRTVKAPASTQVGQLVLVMVEVTGVAVTITMPAGWTKIGQVQNGALEVTTAAWFWRIATTKGAEEATISWGGAGLLSTAITATYKGFDAEQPFAAVALESNGTASTAMAFSAR